MPDSQNDLDFGRYHIQRLLGRGGMGEVYLARDTALERDVAIKFVSSQKLQDSAARARLLREAQAAAGLDHPCICPVHEAGVTEDGRAYIVMPFIDGTPLADIIPRGPMPPREALSICSQVADALATRASPRHRPPRSEARQHHDDDSPAGRACWTSASRRPRSCRT